MYSGFAATSYRRIGTPQQWFQFTAHFLARDLPADKSHRKPHKDNSLILDNYPDSYRQICQSAIRDYNERYAPCQAKWPSGIKGRSSPCIKKKQNHGEMHRRETGYLWSENEWFGTYQTDFHSEVFAWDEMVLAEVKNFERMLRSVGGEDIRQTAAQHHLGTMREFYAELGNLAELTMHATCLACLKGIPEHVLPCGHVLCTPCALDFGFVEENALLIKNCPLHLGQEWRPPEVLEKIKPEFSGIRILTLDGQVNSVLLTNLY